MRENLNTKDFERLYQVCSYIIDKAIAKNYSELSSMLGYSVHTSLSHILHGKTNIPRKLLDKINVLAPQINVDWILTGEGEMIKKRSEVEVKEEIRKVDRFITFLYSENIQIKVALEQLKWTRRAYDKALREDLTLQQLADIEVAYPRLNMNWIMDGTGYMVQPEEVNSIKSIKKLQTKVVALEAKVNRLERYIKKKFEDE